MSWGLALWAGAAALAASALAVTRPNVVHALLCLLAALVALGGAFFALGADFAGAIQLLIYAGAVVAVFVFVVMTIDASPERLAEARAGLRATWRLPAALAAAALLPILGALLLGHGTPGAPAPSGAAELGLLMFGDWAVATELATLLLLAGLMGVRLLGRRPRDRSGARAAAPERGA